MTQGELIKERDEALRKLDIEWARRRCPGIDEFTALVALHKTRYDCATLEDHYRHESGEWLRSYGFKAMQGRPLLPPGQLPR